MGNPGKAIKGMVAENVAEHGWTVMGVGGDAVWPTFAYTIGLTELGHPELLMIGLPPPQAQSLLNDMGGAIKVGRRYTPGERVPQIISHYDVLIRGPINPVRARMIQAINLYGDIDALQVLWPDTGGVFPGETGFTSRFVKVQSLMELA